MIEISHLYKSYGPHEVLKDITVTFDKQVVGILGANGSGKTTLLKCILGILDYEGSIEVHGLNLKDHAQEIKKTMGYIPQYLPLWAEMRVQEAVHFFARLRNVNLKQAYTVLEEFGLAAHVSKKIHMLSGGMRQKLSIALSLMTDPSIVLLDEPTANLDAWATREILSIIKGWRGKKTVLLSSHRLEEVQWVSDHLIQIQDGRLVAPSVESISLKEPFYA